MKRSAPCVTLFGALTPLGRGVVARLVANGYRLRLPVDDVTSFAALKQGSFAHQVQPFLSAVRDDYCVREAVKGSDFVINLIGDQTSGEPSFSLEAHVECVARLARLAKEEGAAKFIHLSTLGTSDEALSRFDRVRSAGEKAVLAFFPEATIIRLADLFIEDEAVSVLPWTIFSMGFCGDALVQPIAFSLAVEKIVMCLENSAEDGRVIECAGREVLPKFVFQSQQKKRQKRAFLSFWDVGKEAAFLAHLIEKVTGYSRLADRIESKRANRLISDQNTGVFVDLGQGSKKA